MSSSVEERIVRMTMENGQFERGAKQSIGTLEKLKNALNFGGTTSIRSLQDFERSFSRLDFSSISRAVDTVNSRFSTMGIAGMTAISRITNAAIDCGHKLMNLAQKPIDIIGEKGWARASNIAQARFQIEGLGKDWEKLYEDMSYAVDGTAYGLDEAARVAAQLSASGIEAGEGMKSYLRGVSGVAAMTNSSYTDIGRIFTTVAGQGRLFADQLNQLSARGINAASVLAKKLNVTEGELREMVSAGKIDFQTFASAMDEAFGEHAKDANKTFTGALSNMKAALGRIGAEFATPIQDALKYAFNSTRKFINAVNKRLKDAGIYEQFKSIFTNIVNAYVWLVDNVDFSWLDKIIDKASKAFSIIDETLGSMISTWNKEFVWSDTGTDLEKILDNGVEVTQTIKNINKMLNDPTTFGFTPLSRIIYSILNAFGSIKDTIDIITTKLKENDRIVNVSRTIYWIIRAISSSLEFIPHVFEAIFKWAGDPLFRIFDTVLEFVQKIAKWVSLFDGWFTESGAWHTFGEAANEVLTLIADGIERAWNAFDAFMTSISDSWEWISGGWLDKWTFGPDSGDIKIAEETTEALAEVATQAGLTQEQIDELANSVIRGDYGNGEERVEALGENYEIVQNRVNELLGSSYRYEIEMENVAEVTGEVTQATEDSASAVEDATDAYGVADGKLNLYTNGLARIGDALYFVATAFKDAFASMDKERSIGQINNIISGLSAGINILAGVLSSIVQGAAKPFAEIVKMGAEALLEAGSAVGVWLQRLNMWMEKNQIYFGIMTTTNKIGWGIVKVLKAIGAVGKLALKAVVISFSKVVEWVVKAKKNFDDFMAAFRKTEGYRQLAFAISAIKHQFGELKEKVFDGISKWLDNFRNSDVKFPKFNATEFAKAVSDRIIWLLEKIKDIREGISSFFTEQKQNPNSIFSQISKFFENFSISKSFETLIDLLKTAKDKILDFFTSFSTNKAKDFKDFGSTFKDIVAAIKEFFKSAFTTGFTNVSDFINNAKESFPQLGDVLDFVWSIIGNITKFNAIRALNGLLSSVSQIAGILKNVKGILGGVGKSIQNFAFIEKGFGKLLKAKAFNETATGLIKIAAAVGIFAVAMKLLGSLSWDQFQIAAGSIMVITGALTALALVINAIKKKGGGGNSPIASLTEVLEGFKKPIKGFLKDIGRSATMIAFSASIALLASTFIKLADMDWEKAKNGLKVMGAVMAEFVVAMGFMGLFSKLGGSMKQAVTVIATAAAIKVIASAFTDLSKIDSDKLDGATEAFSKIMLSLTSLVFFSKRLTKNLGSILGITALIFVVADSVKSLASLNQESLKSTTESITNIIDSLTRMIASLISISADAKVVKFSKGAQAKVIIGAVIALGALVAEIAGIFYLMRNMDTNQMLKTSTAFTKVIKALSLVALAANAFKVEGGGFGATIASNGGAIISADLWLLNIAAIEAIFAGLSQISWTANGEKKTLSDFLNEGLPLIESVARGIGRFIGIIIEEGLLNPIKNTFGGIGEGLDSFVKELMPFVTGSKEVSTEGIDQITELFKKLTSTMFLALIDTLLASFIGKISGTDFGASLSDFASGLVTYSAIIALMDVDAVKNTETAVDTVIALTRKLPNQGGLLAKIIGDNTADEFAFNSKGQNRLLMFARGMVGYSDVIANMKTEAVTKSKEAAETVIALTKSIPNQGGLLAKIIGDNTADEFAFNSKGQNRLLMFARGMVGYSDVIANMKTEAVLGTKLAIQTVLDLASSIPNQGGLLAKIMGDNTADAFAFDENGNSRLKQFAQGMVDYSNTIEGVKTDAVTATKDAVSIILEFAKEIPQTGGLFDYIFGNNDADVFGAKLAEFGLGLLQYSIYVGEADMETAIAVTSKLEEMSTAISNIANNSAFFSLGEAKAQMNNMAGAIVEFFNTFSKEFKNASVADSVQEIGTTMLDYIVQGFEIAASGGDANVNPFSKAIADALSAQEAKTEVSTSAESLAKTIMATIKATITENTESVSQKMSSMLSDAFAAANDVVTKKSASLNATFRSSFYSMAITITNFYETFKAAVTAACSGMPGAAEAYVSRFEPIGKAMMDGLASGIKANKAEAINAAANAAAETVTAARNAVQMNSPAKKFIEIGAYSMAGLAKGFDDNADLGTAAAERAASMTVGTMLTSLSDIENTAVDASYRIFESLKAVYGYINEVIMNNMDVDPTITPVIDLSNIQNGTNLMSKMFQNGAGYALNMGNLSGSFGLTGVVSDNTDIVNAIAELRTDVAGLESAIRGMGITLDDGTLVGKIAPKMSSEMRLLSSRSR